MKVVILAGGLGTRLSEETVLKPKPMVEVGGWPALCHIMRLYDFYGFKEFVLALGYKGNVIKEYFLNFRSFQHDLTIRPFSGESRVHSTGSEDDWIVHLIDTGLSSQTGARLRRLKKWVGNETFMMTYGDGFSDVNLKDLLAFHQRQGALATVTAVRPPARFGGLNLNGNRVAEFNEKPQVGEGWINGGYFVFEPAIFDYIKEGDDVVFEKEPLERLARDGQLVAFKHEGFWQCMDTLRDVKMLEGLWMEGKSPWNPRGIRK